MKNNLLPLTRLHQTSSQLLILPGLLFMQPGLANDQRITASLPMLVEQVEGTVMNQALKSAQAQQKQSKVHRVDAAEAEQLLKNHSDIMVLDVRTAKEFATGRIDSVKPARVKQIDYHADDFKQQLAGLDKQWVYLLHCQSGGRSNKALEVMQALGFQNILHLEGGMQAWQAYQAAKP